MGNIVKRVKIWKVLLLEVFLLVGFLTELCLYRKTFIEVSRLPKYVIMLTL